MADEQPSLHIDSDWKRQAQEEKRRLAEEEQKRAEKAAAAASAPSVAPMPTPELGGAAGMAPAARGAGATTAAGRGRRDQPAATFPNLVQSIATQVFFYLGDLSPQGGEPMLNLDMAKHQIDTLGMLEEKTKGNLGADEQLALDHSLYEVRMRYVSVASQFI